jgi:hypothetical protein
LEAVPPLKPRASAEPLAKHTELVAIGIGHDHPADLALADVDARRPEGDETVGLRSLVVLRALEAGQIIGKAVLTMP